MINPHPPMVSRMSKSLARMVMTPAMKRALSMEASLFALGLALIVAGPVQAQDAMAPAPQPVPQPAPAPAQPITVARILVSGNERIDTQTIQSYLPVHVGEVVDASRVDLSIKTLYRTDLFSDIQITTEGTDLVVKVVENPVINQVVFEGNSALTEEKLRGEVQIRPRGIFTKAKVQADVQKIIELYRRSGRVSATVSPKIVNLPQKRIDLVFEINEGSKTGISSLHFVGNKAFNDRDLAEVAVTKKSEWWKFFSTNDNYDPDRIEYDREQLRKHYTNRGYYDFRVVSAVAELLPNRDKFALTYTLDEGHKYTFGELKVESDNTKLDPKLLEALLPIHQGDLYESSKIESAVDALTFAAGSAGFAFVDIRPQDRANREKRTVDIVFKVREGPRVYVERVDIVGNTQTLDHVVRRELELTEGDAYNKVLLDRSKNNVRALGFFKDVKIDQKPGSAPDKAVVQVQVEEQPTGELSFGAGYSSIEKFVIDLGVSQRNFRGRGENVRARISTGRYRQTIDLGYTVPKFMGRDLSAGIDAYATKYSFANQTSYQSESIGGDLRLGFQLNAYTNLGVHYALQTNKVLLDDSYCTGANAINYASVCENRKRALGSSVGYVLRVNRTNDPIQPTRGWSFVGRQDFSGLGGDVFYVKTELEGRWYYGFSPKWILSNYLSAGHVLALNDDTVRANDRYYKGGTTFRGFQAAGIGPRQITSNGYSNPLGGNTYFIGNFELTVPNLLPENYGVRTSLFTEFGTLGHLDDRYKHPVDARGNLIPGVDVRDDFKLRASAGITVKWKSPMGPIQFDFSQILSKASYDRVETFRFSQSQQF